MWQKPSIWILWTPKLTYMEKSYQMIHHQLEVVLVCLTCRNLNLWPSISPSRRTPWELIRTQIINNQSLELLHCLEKTQQIHLGKLWLPQRDIIHLSISHRQCRNLLLSRIITKRIVKYQWMTALILKITSNQNRYKSIIHLGQSQHLKHVTVACRM